jgi:glycerophosphoryl diester phosphodiesterase
VRSQREQGAVLPARGVAAHRGGAAARPENTLAALREAVRLGAHMVEFDVRATADGHAVLMHDEHVDRTTDGRGRVRELTLDAIRRLDAGAWKDPRFRGEPVPRLEETLDALPRDVWINLQVKWREPIVERAVRAVLERERAHQVLFACGGSDAARARALHPAILVCDLVRRESRAAYLLHAAAAHADFVQLHQLRGDPEPELVARAHGLGLRVNHFCDGREDGIERHWRAGVDFVLVDDVERGLEAARRAGIEPLRPRG